MLTELCNVTCGIGRHNMFIELFVLTIRSLFFNMGPEEPIKIEKSLRIK